MKYIHSFESANQDLIDDLTEIGAINYKGVLVTYQARFEEGLVAEAVAAVGKGWKEIGIHIFDNAGVNEEDFEDYGIEVSDFDSMEGIMDALDSHFSGDMVDYWRDFEYSYWIMKPKRLEDSYESCRLLNPGNVIRMGREFFTDFDSKIFTPVKQ